MAILCSNSDRLIKAVRGAISPAELTIRAVSVQSFPSRADVIVTEGQINSETEFLAMRLRCSGTVVLPEGADWLSERVADGRIEVMAGSDLAKGDKLL